MPELPKYTEGFNIRFKVELEGEVKRLIAICYPALVGFIDGGGEVYVDEMDAFQCFMGGVWVRVPGMSEEEMGVMNSMSQVLEVLGKDTRQKEEIRDNVAPGENRIKLN